MDIGDVTVVEVDLRGIALLAGRGVGVPRDPEKDLAVGGEDIVHLLHRLGDEIGGVDPVTVRAQGLVERGVEDDDGWRAVIFGQFAAQPGQLLPGEAGEEGGVVGREEDQQIVAHIAAIVEARQGKGLLELGQLGFLGLTTSTDQAPLADVRVGIEIVMVAGDGEKGGVQPREELAREGEFLVGTEIGTDIAYRHHHLHVLPGVDGFHHLFLLGDIAPGKMGVAEDHQVVRLLLDLLPPAGATAQGQREDKGEDEHQPLWEAAFGQEGQRRTGHRERSSACGYGV